VASEDSSRFLSDAKGEMFEDIFEFFGYVNEAKSLIADLIQATNDNGLTTLNLESFSKQVAENLGIRHEKSVVILRVLRNLKLMEVRFGRSAKYTVEKITSFLHTAGEPWTEEILGKWEAFAPTLIKLLEDLTPDSNLMISSKAASLAYNRQNILHNCRVLTDVRPVFSESAQEIKGMIVTHSLVLHFSPGENAPIQELHLTMDWRDIEILRDQCDRADLKADSIINSMDDLPWQTVNYPDM